MAVSVRYESAASLSIFVTFIKRYLCHGNINLREDILYSSSSRKKERELESVLCVAEEKS